MTSCCSISVKAASGSRHPITHYESFGGLRAHRPPSSNSSFGVLSFSDKAVTKESVKKLQFTTTNGRFLERGSLADEGTNEENLHRFYNFGHAKGTGQRREYSCLWGVPDKSYSRDFDGRPAVDFHENIQLAESFRPKPHDKAPDTGEGRASTYMALHRQSSREAMRKARQDNCQLEQASKSERTLGGVGSMLEIASSTHRKHAWPGKDGRGEKGREVPNFLAPAELVHRGLNSTYRSEVGPRREGSAFAAPRLGDENTPLRRSASTPLSGGQCVKMPFMFSLNSDL